MTAPAAEKVDAMKRAVAEWEAAGKAVKAVRYTRSGAVEVEFFEPRPEQARPAWSAR